MAAGVCPSFCSSLFYLSILILIQSSQGRLYNITDNIVLVDNSSVANVLYDSPVAWTIEFYSSWCGHCQAFAPTWKKLAESIKDWRSVVRIAALDCAEERNLDTCRDFAIEAYPTIRFFNASTKDRKNLGETFHDGSKTFINLLHSIVDLVETQTETKEPKPHFHPVKGKDDILNDEKGGTQVIIFEEEDSYIGREVALDIMKYPSLKLRRAVKFSEKTHPLALEYSISVQYPSMWLVERGYAIEMSRNDRSRHGFKNSLNSLGSKMKMKQRQFREITEVEEANRHYASLHANTGYTIKHVGSSTEVYLQDMNSGLAYIVWREIPVKRTIDKESFSALLRFFNLVHKCFPGNPSTNAFFKDLKDQLSHMPYRALTGSIFERHVRMTNRKKAHEHLAHAHLNKTIAWQACQGSSERYRGYPCSLWTLFHTLTVQCGERNVSTGLDTLLAIRGYIKNFFTCKHCVRHFTEMAKDIEHEVKTHDEAILWLWKGHNKANKRLHGDPSEDPEHPKIQFPSSDMCSNCREENGDFKTPVVLEFLKDHYGLDNIRIREHVKAPPELDDVDLEFADYYKRVAKPGAKKLNDDDDSQLATMTNEQDKHVSDPFMESV